MYYKLNTLKKDSFLPIPQVLKPEGAGGSCFCFEGFCYHWHVETETLWLPCRAVGNRKNDPDAPKTETQLHGLSQVFQQREEQRGALKARDSLGQTKGLFLRKSAFSSLLSPGMGLPASHVPRQSAAETDSRDAHCLSAHPNFMPI